MMNAQPQTEWADGESAFAVRAMREELLEDADWAEVVDQLNVALRAAKGGPDAE